MSKPTLVPLPFLLLLLDFWPLQRFQLSDLNDQSSTLRRLILEKLPFLALSAASIVVTIRAYESLGALLSTDELPLSARLANVPVACALYLRKLVWPVDLSVFYLHPGSWPAGTVALSTLLVLGITAVALGQARRRPYLIVGWLWWYGRWRRQSKVQGPKSKVQSLESWVLSLKSQVSVRRQVSSSRRPVSRITHHASPSVVLLCLVAAWRRWCLRGAS
jgi:hypothetical protein